ncbi:MAG: S1/P1 nuclease [Isosphaeraceae bacterium]
MRTSLRRGLIVAVAAGLAWGQAPAAWAWGARGHRIATRVAEARLSPAARAAVRELLHEGDTLLTVCNWADHEGHEVVPASAPWHYVNVPLEAERYTDRDCRGGNCVVAKIRQFRKVVADKSRPKEERARALLFLVHLVQDVHQPLHVGDRRDRGGTDTQVRYRGEGVNLHRLWDSAMIDAQRHSEQEWVHQIEPLLTPANVAKWSQGSVESWADESLIEARRAYRDIRNPGRFVTTGDAISDDYVEVMVPVIQTRLAQAGVRLANELNAAFAEAGSAPVKEKAKSKAPAAKSARPRAASSSAPGRE